MTEDALRGTIDHRLQPSGAARRAPRRAFLARVSAAVLGLVVALPLAGCGGGGGGGAQSTVVAQPTGSGPATLRIANVSNEAIYYIHMSPTSQNTWGPDLLGNQVLQRGQVFTISNIGPGYWDVRVVDRSGNRKEWYNQFFEAGGSYEVQVDADGWMTSDGQH